MKFASSIFLILTISNHLLVAQTRIADLGTDLIGYYPFESNFDNLITTNGLPNGTAVNSPSAGTVGGKFGNAMSLQGGDNDHMSLTASFGTGNTLGENFTVSAWYKLNDPISSASGSNRYFIYEASNNFDVSFSLRDQGLGIAGINDAQAYTDGSSIDIADVGLSGWHHIAQTYTSSDTITIISTYVDGVPQDDLTVTTASLTGSGINFGAARDSVTNRGFDGLIDEVALWNRSLSRAELAAIYALGLNSKPLISSAPPSSDPTITSFTGSPLSVLLGESCTLNWNVTGAETVTIVKGLDNVASSGSRSVTMGSDQIYTLVAINGNTIFAEQVAININGPTEPVGPYVGTVKTTEAYFLYRPGQTEETLRLTVMTEQGALVTSVDSDSLATNDFVAKFHVTGLTEGTKYLYKIEKVEGGGGLTLYAGNTSEHYFSTVPIERSGQIVTTAFVSCVNDTSDLVWAEMANHNLDLLCLAGDTPYVDTGVLSSIRQKHRNFLQRSTLAPLLRNTSVVGTWDDHDFGLNGGNGISTASLKVNTRQVFVEYRAHDRYGHSNEGIYHKTDMGAMEVFLLDPRWFSQTEASPVDNNQSSCFGSVQWLWLLDAIRNSEAPFKVILQGQIWQDKKNSETDDMHTYYAERDALLDIIKNENIPGVVLFGGDIHVARYLKHPQRVGYDLHDFVMSPGHKSVISSLNVYHPSLEWSLEEQNQFLTMTADTTKAIPVLTVKYLDQDGTINHQLVIPYNELTPKVGAGLAKDLRAYWTFDTDTSNQSILGTRIDGAPSNGASVVSPGGIRNGALNLSRSSSQYLSIPRSFLDDNAANYTISSWCKPSSLPAHGSSERQFIMESKVNNHVGLPQASTKGYAISVGLRATTDSQKINLQLYTETLDAKPVGSQQSPTSLAQGPFDCDLDRTLFDDWAQIGVTFDSTTLKVYANGALIKQHTLTTPGPIAETGGLVIGGHRTGTGRNFDGLIDEVAIWQRVLTDVEIASLYNSGTAPDIPVDVAHIDTDDDGLPNWWETIHNLDPAIATNTTNDTDGDSLDLFKEFAFGTDPNVNESIPWRQSFSTVADEEYQSIIYQRNPDAMDFVNLNIERSTDAGVGDAWNPVETLILNITPLANGLEEVTQRSTFPVSAQDKEFLRVSVSKAN